MFKIVYFFCVSDDFREPLDVNETWRGNELPPSTPTTHRTPRFEDTLNTTAAVTTQHSLLATPSQAIRPDGNLGDAQEQGSLHQDNQSLLNLLFNIAEDQARKGNYDACWSLWKRTEFEENLGHLLSG